MGTNPEYLAGIQLQLNSWDKQFDALVAEGRKTSGETRTAYDRRLKELRLGRKATQKAIESARGATAALAAQAQNVVTTACDDMRAAIEKVTSDLRALPPDGRVRKAAPEPVPVPQPESIDAPQPAEATAT